MDCKVIYGFYLLINFSLFRFSFVWVESEKLFGLDLELVKTTLRQGGGWRQVYGQENYFKGCVSARNYK